MVRIRNEVQDPVDSDEDETEAEADEEGHVIAEEPEAEAIAEADLDGEDVVPEAEADPDDDVFGDENNEEFYEPVFEENQLMLVCPVCDLHFQVNEFRNHLLYTHPEFVAIWASALFGPMFHEDEYLDFVRGVIVDTYEFPNVDVDNMTYEQLLELCEEIGDHKEGIADVEQVLEKMSLDDLTEETKCPICLEEFCSIEDERNDVVEKIKLCGHVFCSQCIRKWFTENKRCPLCKGDAS